MSQIRPSHSRLILNFLHGLYLGLVLPMNKSIRYLVLSLLFIVPSLQADPFDVFAAGIENDLNDRCVGFGYAIFQDGNFMRGGGGGFAVKGLVSQPFTGHTVKDCHSMSKTITAAALLLALEEGQVSRNAEMWLYLPADLQAVIPENSIIRTVTFDNLLRHRSGFTPSMSFSWTQLRDQLASANGTATPLSTYRYSNWNYAACRVIIPYVLNLEGMRSMEANVANLSDGGIEFLDTVTSTVYANYVQNKVFNPAGLGTIHPRPVDETLPVFARYYDHADPTVLAQIMPDRRLTVGSGGWALSARQYGQFISSLFRGDVISIEDLEFLQANNRGMFSRLGSDGIDTYYTHNGATTGNGVGGRSVWMAFPGDIQVAVQVNSINNEYGGSGRNLTTIVQEAYEHAFATPPSSISFPLHLLFHREADGWITSRGIGNNGNLGARNFDYDFSRNDAPKGMIQHRFLSVDNQAFLLRYSPHDGSGSGNGRAFMHRINTNGTLGTQVFTSSNWLPGWTDILTFGTPNGTFLLLHNSATGRIRTVPVTATGNLNPAVTDFVYTSGFNVAEILTISGTPHLLRHNSTTGHTHLRILNADGSVGATAFEDTWSLGFTNWETFRAGGNTFIFRYNPIAGAARINRVDGSLANVPQVFNTTQWLAGLTSFRFFEIGSQAYFIWYDAVSGLATLQQVTAGGVPDTGDDAVAFQTTWLQETVGTASNPSRTGWTGLEVYDATPGFSNPNLGLNTFPDLPPIELSAVIPEPQHTSVIALVPEIPQITKAARTVELTWLGRQDVLYLVEESTDLRRWLIIGAGKGADRELTFPSVPDSRHGSSPNALFYRIRSMQSIPPLPRDPTQGP